jgi:N-alpha-acetyltransferase 15/16, NatA auxiliary subunit
MAEKYVLALRCLNAALALDASDPRVHEQVVHFSKVLHSKLGSLPPQVQEVLKSEFTATKPSTDLEEYNNDFEAKHKESPVHRISAIKTKKVLGEDTAACERELGSILEMAGITWETAKDVLRLLREWRSTEVDAFKKKASAKWPEVTAFA